MLIKKCSVSTLAAMSVLLMQDARAADTLEAALTGGKVSLDMRYRYEFVDDKRVAPTAPLSNADASTLRTRLGYTTDTYQGWGAVLEMENISVLGNERYNNTINGQVTKSVVADPKGTEINQVYLSYSGFDKTVAKFGRQRIILDNQRWVGNVGWRQNEQTYDGLSIVNTALSNTRITYANIYGVERVFGPSSPVGRFSSNSNLVNVAYSGWSAGTLVGYGYWLDLKNAATSSSRTLGARFSGKQSPSQDWNVLYTLELARQSDYANNPANFGLNYRLMEIGAAAKGITGKLGYEYLQGNGTVALQTPLATLHAMNGWADKFLTTPAKGLQDIYFSADGSVMDVKLMVVYHKFSATTGGANYGNEWDLHAWRTFGKYTLGAKYAAYSAANPISSAVVTNYDTTKMWLYGEFKF